MCGIYGYVSNNQILLNKEKELFEFLWKNSESRGKEACGVCLSYGENLDIFKFGKQSSKSFKNLKFQKKLSGFVRYNSQKILLGHTRLQTHGNRDSDINNQPLTSKNLVLLHNGIICNYQDILNKYGIEKKSDLDSEAIIRTIELQIENKNIVESIKKIFSDIEGEASIAIYNSKTLNLATNCGNIYYVFFENTFEIIFASEYSFLKKLPIREKYNIEKIEAGSLISFNLNKKNLVRDFVNLSKPKKTYNNSNNFNTNQFQESFWEESKLQICKKGILNENMPGIKFDKEGISNFSKLFKPHVMKNQNIMKEKFLELNNKQSNIIVGFSGGRDSSYMLHLLKNKYNLNPIAVTYDWGMVTDLARRNQARICGQLGIEHVIVAADIPLKRKYIKSYLEGWLKDPKLGMVPLLMAGDKQYFRVLNEVALKNDIKLISFGSAPYEFTSFKTGFAGVIDNIENEKELSNILQAKKLNQKMKLSLYYLKNVLGNSAYWNRSMIDAAQGFKYSYFEKKEYLQFFDYELWNEEHINKVLIDEYGWETDPSTPSTWRIGDGTAPFYNFIYMALAGFTENDTFRNNQVLSGVLNREDALKMVKLENQPRFEKIKEYLDLIELDYESTIEKILTIKI